MDRRTKWTLLAVVNFAASFMGIVVYVVNPLFPIAPLNLFIVGANFCAAVSCLENR